MFANNGSHALRKDMCQRPLVLHLKLQGAAKNDGLDAEKYFNKYHYEAPFLTLTWARWLEVQQKMLEAFCRFQRAVDKEQPQLATIIALEMQEMVSELQREACAWVGEAQIKTKPR